MPPPHPNLRVYCAKNAVHTQTQRNARGNMRKGVQLADFVILILLALALAVIAWRAEELKDVRFLFVLGALFFLAAAIVIGIQLIQQNAANTYKLRKEAEASTPAVLVMQYAVRLQPWQASALEQLGPGLIAAIPDGYESPQIYRLQNGNSTTLDFIRRVVDFTGDEVLTIRDIKPEDRAEARELVNDFIRQGWVKAARGQNAAKWINKQAAIAALNEIGGNNES